MVFSLKDILRLEVAPALGCTEPVAVALAAAAAASLIDERPFESIEAWVDPNIYKNGMAVTIPGSNNLSGLDKAAALGAFGGDPKLGLEVLDSVSEHALDQVVKFCLDPSVPIHLLENVQGICVRVRISAGGRKAEAEIRDFHDQIVRLTLDGKNLETHPLLFNVLQDKKPDRTNVEAWIKGLTLDELLGLVDQLDDEDRKFLKEGVDVNMRLAEHGLKYGPGLGIGRAFERLIRQNLICKDMVLAARMLASAAADARMAGVNLPAMSSAGSGNHGLTAILPIWAVKDHVTCAEAVVIEALGISHMITAYIKAHTGRLSAICGCSVAAGAGAAAGVAYLLGGTTQHIAGAITNLIEDLAGVICDGAKPGCALKLATAAGTAVQSALFALQGVRVQATDGITGASPEKTMQNIGTLSREGMIETDRTILKIMIEKKFTEKE
ncbi:L-serine ammonia-lyase, iron-sulfur-dependent, subunit alpha [uncultured Desulfobacter sp.]|uniref:L-cysteine desulfidase family protein n=1 Tax=uncultured Desulfobacter sp. TaxID=240139 RepID=UPI002AA61F0B|nr:L-serine ammonia-lyase, iron-sulfur-dependent, subunit alpha [uncultured Desulfobacter sp.]